jgi:hypothetical protein
MKKDFGLKEKGGVRERKRDRQRNKGREEKKEGRKEEGRTQTSEPLNMLHSPLSASHYVRQMQSNHYNVLK